jgi:hypothetical protein
LSKESRLRVFFPIAIFACSFLAAACVEPLGPGFFFLDRHAEIRATDATRGAALHIKVVDFFTMPEIARFGRWKCACLTGPLSDRRICV